MGIKALIEYSLLKELCDHVKRDNTSFTGRIKSRIPYDGKVKKKKGISEIKQLLLSKSKHASPKRKEKRVKKNNPLDKQSPASVDEQTNETESGSGSSSSSGTDKDDSASSDSSSDDGNSDNK